MQVITRAAQANEHAPEIAVVFDIEEAVKQCREVLESFDFEANPEASVTVPANFKLTPFTEPKEFSDRNEEDDFDLGEPVNLKDAIGHKELNADSDTPWKPQYEKLQVFRDSFRVWITEAYGGYEYRSRTLAINPLVTP